MKIFFSLDLVFWHTHQAADHTKVPWSTQSLLLWVQKKPHPWRKLTFLERTQQGLFKNIWHAPPPPPLALSWRPKKFNCHQIMGVCWMATNLFRSPSHTPPPTDGDWNFSVTKEGMGGGGFFCQKWYYMHPSPLAFWQLILLRFHSTYPHCWMLTRRGGLLLLFWGKKMYLLLSYLGNWLKKCGWPPLWRPKHFNHH